MKITLFPSLLVLVLFCYSPATSQLLSLQTVNSGGRSATNNNVQLEYAVGEFVVTEFQNTNATLTQGFIQPTLISGALPVRYMDFQARRISNKLVQINWRTAQEISNKGFYIERKKTDDAEFSQVSFMKSAAPNGNAFLPINYQYFDNNSLNDKTYYRLKQEDLDGRSTYSALRLVNGSDSKMISINAWPVPSSGPVNIRVDGIDQDQLLVSDNNGRLVKQVAVSAQGAIQIIGLTPGVYIVKLASDKQLYQRIIIQ